MNKIKYPIQVKKIKFPNNLIAKNYWNGKIGDWVAVRPCNEKYKGKTYLGILLGELPVGSGCTYSKKKELEFYLHLNPAMYVPEIKDIIFGCGSWWHVLKKPEDLKKITKKRINNVWYVKALKELGKIKGKTEIIIHTPKGDIGGKNAQS